MSKIIVGMSGGVDSAVVAYLLRLAGHNVFGVTLRTSLDKNRCCEIDDARAVCDLIGIPFYAVNCAADFREKVIQPFIGDYINGRTPNPCINCNRDIKWAQLMDSMSLVGAEYVATGHYASITKLQNGRYTVKKATHADKDQTYMLCRLTQEQLAHTIMPLGGLSKSEVRELAEKAGLPVAQKKDSQEICFVPDGKYAEFVNYNSDQPIPPPGNFVDEAGNILGMHSGIVNYTVGQRKGLGIALGRPAYVKRIDTAKNEVVISDDEALYSSVINCEDLSFMSIAEPAPGTVIRANVRIRYRHAGEDADVEIKGDGSACIRFDRPVRAATPGQAAVLYDDEGCVIGGGTII